MHRSGGEVIFKYFIEFVNTDSDFVISGGGENSPIITPKSLLKARILITKINFTGNGI
jgi:hypothetical protein